VSEGPLCLSEQFIDIFLYPQQSINLCIFIYRILTVIKCNIRVYWGQ